MDRKLTDLALYRAGWGDNSIALDDDLTTEPADVIDSLPRLIRVRCTRGLADFLSWPDRSGRALQCLFQIEPVGRPGSSRLMAAEAVRRASRADACEIELVDGWRGEPYFWGNRSLHEEEIEAAVHGMPPGADLQLIERHLPQRPLSVGNRDQVSQRPVAASGDTRPIRHQPTRATRDRAPAVRRAARGARCAAARPPPRSVRPRPGFAGHPPRDDHRDSRRVDREVPGTGTLAVTCARRPPRPAACRPRWQPRAQP